MYVSVKYWTSQQFLSDYYGLVVHGSMRKSNPDTQVVAELQRVAENGPEAGHCCLFHQKTFHLILPLL